MNNISFVEFAENYLGMELFDCQKKYLTEMYDIYKKNGNKFPERTFIPNGMPIWMSLIYDKFIKNRNKENVIIDEFYKFESKEVKENE